MALPKREGRKLRKDNKVDHSIPPEILNSDILYCIKEYVRLVRDRRILRDHWFRGITFEALAEKYDVSTTVIKNVIYDVGDDIIILAAERSAERNAQEKSIKNT